MNFIQELYDFLEAVITRQTAPEDAYRRLDEMATRKTEMLRKLTKLVNSIYFLFCCCFQCYSGIT